MTSKISFFSIMKQDIRHRLWMAALSLLGSILSLPVFLLMCRRDWYASISEILPRESVLAYWQGYYVSFFSEYAVVTQGVILVAGAFIVSIFGFRYLYSRKMTDQFHSLPVTRSRLFLACYLDGLLIWLLPFLASVLITLILILFFLGGFSYFGPILLAALKFILLCVTVFLMVYHLCLIAVMISGNAFNAIVSALLLGTLAAAIYSLLSVFCNAYLDTFLTMPLSYDKVIWLSPLVSAVILLAHPVSANYNFTFLYISSLLVLAAAFGGAWKLYLIRPSEIAEKGLPNKWFQGLLRTGGSLVIGMCGSLMFYGILGNDTLGWCLFGTLLGGFLSYGVLDIIFNMDFKNFFAHKWGMCATTVASMAVFVTIFYDLTGFDARVPHMDDIAGADILIEYYTDNSYYLSVDDNNAIYKEYGNAPRERMNFQDKEVIFNLLSYLSENNYSYFDQVTAVVKLTNGGKFYRAYSLPIVSEELASLMRPLVESQEYKSTYYALSSGLLPAPSQISVEGNNATYHIRNGKDDINTLLEAYRKDFDANYSLELLENGVRVCTLDLQYILHENNRYHSYLPVYENYTHTIELLKLLAPGAVTTSDNVRITALTIKPNYNPVLPKEYFYSYFGLNGYPSGQEFEKKFWEEEKAAPPQADTVQAIHPEDMAAGAYYDKTTEPNRYHLKINKQSDIQELLPLLYFGHVEKTDLPQRFVYLGEAVTEDGDIIRCYVKMGELPKKWIDQMEIGEE